jgi:hypothetical protein
MKHLNYNIFLLLLLLKVCAAKAQTADKTVTLTVSGQGETLDKARQSALRTAIEQAYGTFISAKTEILNDEMVADQITSVSAGNIKSFETLNEAQLPNATWAVTLKAVVSIEKLTSFVQSKGYEVEVKGGLFTLNIKQQLLNEQGEIDAICEMIGVLHEPMQTSFDYLISNGEPKSVDDDSKNWEIPLEVYTVANANLDVCMDYLFKTLSAIALAPSEVESYKSLNKKTYPVIVFSGDTETIFYFRKAKSIKALINFIHNWEFYTSLFEVNDGANISNYHNIPLNFSINEYSKEKVIYTNTPERWNLLHGEYSTLFQLGRYYKSEVYEMRPYHGNDYFISDSYTNKRFLDYSGKLSIRLFQNNDTIARFVWKDRKSLTELEKLERYSVKSKGLISEFKHGGYVIYQDSGHGMVASIFDVDANTFTLCKDGFCNSDATNVSLYNIDSVCSLHHCNGYNDWIAPSLDDMKFIFQRLFSNNISIFDATSFLRARESWNRISPYLTKSDSGLVFLDRHSQIKKDYYINLILNPKDYTPPEKAIKEHDIIRSNENEKVVLLEFINKNTTGRVRPVRKF